MTRRHDILLRHHMVELPAPGDDELPAAVLATLTANLASYGYALTREAFLQLRGASLDDATAWWASAEPALRAARADDRDMGEHVVYKNFPAEVLDKSWVEKAGSSAAAAWRALRSLA